MRTSMVFASLFLLLSTRAHGLRRLDMQLHATLGNQEDIPDSKLRHSPAWRPMNTRDSRRSRGTMSEQPMGTAHGDPEEYGDVKMMARTHAHAVAPRLFHEDYAGPSGHSPNHHRTIPCVPC